MGYYAAADGNVRTKGTMYLVLHAQGDYAHGRWVGLSYDGPVISGYATLARTQDDAQAVMTRLSTKPRRLHDRPRPLRSHDHRARPRLAPNLCRHSSTRASRPRRTSYTR